MFYGLTRLLISNLTFRLKMFLLVITLQACFTVVYITTYHSDFKALPQYFLIGWFLLSVALILIVISLIIYIISKYSMIRIILLNQKEKYGKVGL